MPSRRQHCLNFYPRSGIRWPSAIKTLTVAVATTVQLKFRVAELARAFIRNDEDEDRAGRTRINELDTPTLRKVHEAMEALTGQRAKAARPPRPPPPEPIEDLPRRSAENLNRGLTPRQPWAVAHLAAVRTRTKNYSLWSAGAVQPIALAAGEIAPCLLAPSDQPATSNHSTNSKIHLFASTLGLQYFGMRPACRCRRGPCCGPSDVVRWPPLESASYRSNRRSVPPPTGANCGKGACGAAIGWISYRRRIPGVLPSRNRCLRCPPKVWGPAGDEAGGHGDTRRVGCSRLHSPRVDLDRSIFRDRLHCSSLP